MKLGQQTLKDIDRAFKALEALDEIKHIKFTMYDHKEVLDRQEVLQIINQYTKGETDEG